MALGCTMAFAQGLATVVGKVEVKTVGAVKTCTIAVASATGADGKAIDALKGKALKVVGAKCADVEKLVGKNVEAKGTLKEKDTQIDVATVAEKVAEKK